MTKPENIIILPSYDEYQYLIMDRHNLVGGFNPFEKYARQIGSSPQGRAKKNILKKNIWNHHHD